MTRSMSDPLHGERARVLVKGTIQDVISHWSLDGMQCSRSASANIKLQWWSNQEWERTRIIVQEVALSDVCGVDAQ